MNFMIRKISMNEFIEKLYEIDETIIEEVNSYKKKHKKPIQKISEEERKRRRNAREREKRIEEREEKRLI